MSSKALNWAFSCDISPAGKKLVLIAMADGADEYGVFWSGYGTLSRKTSMDRTTVIRHVSDLVEGGYIEKINRFKSTGEKRSNLYKLSVGIEIPEDHRLAESYEVGSGKMPLGGSGISPLGGSGNLPLGSGELPRPEPSLEPKEKKALSRSDFLREMQEALKAGSFAELTDSETIINIEAGAVWDHWQAYGHPPGCHMAAFRGWLKKSRAIRAVEKLAEKSVKEAAGGGVDRIHGLTDTAWRIFVSGYVRYRQPGKPVPAHAWNSDRLGPPPDQPDTHVPREILAEFFPDGRIPGENTHA